ncbi:hypothetical protein AA14337_2921 [Acetobacter malorum DSM 14337]|uniref:Phage protein n=1 Tax=Acetobacter malorum DSM 14337 TaxID=1307910 RepID=A0ABQ0PYK6_9PROT|nr:hypothetical protein [Acetobacter malorum]KXV06775.1 hypothetical protein AD930_06665 [Acetobacter malorum]GBQ84819.1 hypothetical protein AA14337_2921 [Acetobacter malorum DSM 14337]
MPIPTNLSEVDEQFVICPLSSDGQMIAVWGEEAPDGTRTPYLFSSREAAAQAIKECVAEPEALAARARGDKLDELKAASVNDPEVAVLLQRDFPDFVPASTSTEAEPPAP